MGVMERIALALERIADAMEAQEVYESEEGPAPSATLDG